MSAGNRQANLPLGPPPVSAAGPGRLLPAQASPAQAGVGQADMGHEASAGLAAPLSFGQLLPRLAPGLTMLVGAPLASPLALPFCAPYLLQGQTVMAVDGANCFELYRLTEWARRKQVDPLELLRRLRVARAFTPFQLATILHHMDAEMQRHRARRLVITGFPDCLFDEELGGVEARNTFARCRQSLLELSARSYTMLLFTDPPRHGEPRLLAERCRFLDALAAQARMVLEVANTHHAEFRAIKAPAASPAAALPASLPPLEALAQSGPGTAQSKLQATAQDVEPALEEVPHG